MTPSVRPGAEPRGWLRSAADRAQGGPCDALEASSSTWRLVALASLAQRRATRSQALRF